MDANLPSRLHCAFRLSPADCRDCVRYENEEYAGILYYPASQNTFADADEVANAIDDDNDNTWWSQF